METPPAVLDGARVLQFASLARSQPPVGLDTSLRVPRSVASQRSQSQDTKTSRAAFISSTAIETGTWSRIRGTKT